MGHGPGGREPATFSSNFPIFSTWEFRAFLNPGPFLDERKGCGCVLVFEPQLKRPIHPPTFGAKVATISQMLFNVLIAALLPLLVIAYDDPLVKLDYVSLQGKYNGAYNISYFQKIPFAAPPVGENRFRRPQSVGRFSGIYDSDVPYDMCPQRLAEIGFRP